MEGYFHKPKETEEVLTPDGWLSTGDIATCDDEGYYYITGRKKELIVASNGNGTSKSTLATFGQQRSTIFSAMPRMRAGIWDGLRESVSVNSFPKWWIAIWSSPGGKIR